ncbi:hypothetical protein NL676_014774 [Syzygium grande]|nr:hypothetical protein NL676_014774 [Syzygium grande]
MGNCLTLQKWEARMRIEDDGIEKEGAKEGYKVEFSKEGEGRVASMGGNENDGALVPLHLTQAMMELSLKRKAGQDVEGMADLQHSNWLCIGDFDDIDSDIEKPGGRSMARRNLNGFNEMLL